jgi:hypothetical protein
MVFWIVVVLTAALIVWGFIAGILEDGFVMGVGYSMGALCIGALVGGITVLLLLLVPATHTRSEVFPLRALSNQSSVKGEFFLGSGYINGAQQFSYIEQDNGYSMLLTADASASRVFEGAAKPTVTEYTQYYSNPWVLPWGWDTGYLWDFHIPKGAVQTNYQVSTK